MGIVGFLLTVGAGCLLLAMSAVAADIYVRVGRTRERARAYGRLPVGCRVGTCECRQSVNR
jgi:hypothetical protein